MKKLSCMTITLIALAVITAPALIAGDTDLPEGQAKVDIAISGMSCGACCTKVESAVASLEGVVNVKADYKASVASVVYEPEKVNVETIVNTINTKTSFKAKAPDTKSS